MTHALNLLDYLPPFAREYRELTGLTEAETPEFRLAWGEADALLSNTFIRTANLRGIARYEALLRLTPKVSDDLEARRGRVLAKWMDAIPYTLRSLIRNLETICGAGNFALTPDFGNYHFSVELRFPAYTAYRQLHDYLRGAVPANLTFTLIPVIASRISLREVIRYSGVVNNYILGLWRLGEHPFREEKGWTDMESRMEITPEMLGSIAAFAEGRITAARINGGASITDFTEKTAEAGTVTLQYDIAPGEQGEPITEIELLAGDAVWTRAAGEIEVAGDMAVKHILTFEGGEANG